MFAKDIEAKKIVNVPLHIASHGTTALPKRDAASYGRCQDEGRST